VSIGVAAVTEIRPKAEELMARAHRASAELKKTDEQDPWQRRAGTKCRRTPNANDYGRP